MPAMPECRGQVKVPGACIIGPGAGVNEFPAGREEKGGGEGGKRDRRRQYKKQTGG